MGNGIDQMNLQSVQPGYLKILQMGNADPRPKSRKTNTSPSQLGGRHSNPIVTTPMIALDFSGTTQQSASHNVASNQVIKSICQRLNMYACMPININAQCIQCIIRKTEHMSINSTCQFHVIHISKSHNINHNMFTLKAAKGCSNSYLNSSKFYLTDNSNHGRTHGRRNHLSPGSKITAAVFLELKSVQELKSTRNAHPKAHASRRFTDLTARRHGTSRSSSNR
ncbi:hypothetical protein F511_42463 [Dorcoceras hygrometricum]|uniref:Uncharacterized protein n=1 Tax=Dorcoceras hygrometricum TaxID=472368 RepID=A0A2Z7BQR5_9LAMI|nr:hypothetical protein F511_42463 [Dorcoceras hygrometricum]